MNNRIFFACHQVGIKGDGVSTFNVLHGVQSVGMTTNFSLSQTFELGQLAIYENVENIPDIEMTITKVLDGYPLAYHEATIQATEGPSLINRANAKCIAAIGIFSDTADSASGPPLSQVQASGLFVSSLRYSFPLEEDFNEQLTLVGNNKMWANDPNLVGNEPWAGANSLVFDGGFTSLDSPIGSGGVNRRENMNFLANTTLGLDANGMVADPDCTILPPDIFGISASGTNEKTNGDNFDVSISNIDVSVDVTREEIFQMGRKGPFSRTIQFPIQVTCEITTISTSGDMVSGTEYGIRTPAVIAACEDGGNLQDRTIRIATCEGTRIYLGTKNKLASVNYTGGDATGGNVEVTYTYNTFNELTVMHSGDPNSSGINWWNNRSNYLVTL